MATVAWDFGSVGLAMGGYGVTSSGIALVLTLNGKMAFYNNLWVFTPSSTLGVGSMTCGDVAIANELSGGSELITDENQLMNLGGRNIRLVTSKGVASQGILTFTFTIYGPGGSKAYECTRSAWVRGFSLAPIDIEATISTAVVPVENMMRIRRGERLEGVGS